MTATSASDGATPGAKFPHLRKVFNAFLANDRRARRLVMVSRGPAAAGLVFAASMQLVGAQDANRGIVTTIALKSCRVVAHGPGSTAWQCPGIEGYPVHIATSDDRYFFSAGARPERRRAGQQTLHATNTIFPNATMRVTVEWRVQHSGERVVPYATILRYYTATETARGQVLVVNRITQDQTCQVAMIDAIANADAMARARQVADTLARDFDCARPPIVEGETGKSPM